MQLSRFWKIDILERGRRVHDGSRERIQPQSR